MQRDLLACCEGALLLYCLFCCCVIGSFPKLDQTLFFARDQTGESRLELFGKTLKSSHQSNQKLSALDHPIAKRRFGLVQKKFGQLTKFGETILASHQKLSGRLSCFWSRDKKSVWSSFGNDPLIYTFTFGENVVENLEVSATAATCIVAIIRGCYRLRQVLLPPSSTPQSTAQSLLPTIHLSLLLTHYKPISCYQPIHYSIFLSSLQYFSHSFIHHHLYHLFMCPYFHIRSHSLSFPSSSLQ